MSRGKAHSLPRRPLVLAILLLGVDPPAGGQCPSPLHTFSGSAGGELLGFSLAGAGDVDGDGVPDLIVGAPLANPSGIVGAGQASVFSGANGLLLYTFDGSFRGGRLGHSVAGAGDVDGDGRADLVVGAPLAAPGGLVAAGEARVYSGANGALLFIYAGSAAEDRLGSSVAAAGDVDGDGLADILVGASQGACCNSPPPPGPGYAKVLSGATGSALSTLSWTGGWFGASVAGAGDVDGDGTPDFLVGAPLPVGGVGQAIVFSGASGATLFTFLGAIPGDRFGFSVAGGGDMNGDGVPELLVGAPSFDPGGYARAFSGANGSILFTAYGFFPTSAIGYAVAGLGDVDGDGKADVVVGDVGGVSNIGQARVLSGANGATLVTLTAAGPGEWFGASVAGVSDLDGNGVPDAFVGAPRADPAGVPDAGQARVFYLWNPPAGSTPFGTGCPGSGGYVPLIAAQGGDPCLGNPSFRVGLWYGLGGATAILAMGTSNASWAGLPLPLTLGSSGASVCSLLVSPDVLLATTAAGSGPGAGFSSIALPVPPDPALSGAFAYFQWHLLDPGSAVPIGALSRGLRVVVH